MLERATTRQAASRVEREDNSTSTTLLGSGSDTFKRDTGGCALRSKVYSGASFGSRMPMTSSDARAGSVRLAACSARMPVNSTLGATPSQDRRQNLALVGANSTRLATNV